MVSDKMSRERDTVHERKVRYDIAPLSHRWSNGKTSSATICGYYEYLPSVAGGQCAHTPSTIYLARKPMRKHMARLNSAYSSDIKVVDPKLTDDQ